MYLEVFISGSDRGLCFSLAGRYLLVYHPSRSFLDSLVRIRIRVLSALHLGSSLKLQDTDLIIQKMNSFAGFDGGRILRKSAFCRSNWSCWARRAAFVASNSPRRESRLCTSSIELFSSLLSRCSKLINWEISESCPATTTCNPLTSSRSSDHGVPSPFHLQAATVELNDLGIHHEL